MRGRVCDLFAGSGTVSLALSSERPVVAADIQEYSRVLCTALLNPCALDDAAVAALLEQIGANQQHLQGCLEPILEAEQRALAMATQQPTLLCDLVEAGPLLAQHDGRDTLAVALREVASRVHRQAGMAITVQYFGGIYFSYRQALYIDSVLGAVAGMPPGARETCLAALLSTTSSLVNTVGKQFAQPMRPRRSDGTIKSHVIRQMCRDRTLDGRGTFLGWLSQYRALPRGGDHQVVRGDYREVLRELDNVSVIYADPPYTRDHYSRFYHVLETLCLRDYPDISKAWAGGRGPTSRGFYRIGRHQSPFCIKSQAPSAFAELFKGARKVGVPLLVSYSPFVKNGRPRLLTVEGVSRIAEEYYRQVKVVAVGQVTHSKLNRTELSLAAAPCAEVFIVCRN